MFPNNALHIMGTQNELDRLGFRVSKFFHWSKGYPWTNFILSLFHCYFILVNYIKLLIWEKDLWKSLVFESGPQTANPLSPGLLILY